MINDVNHFDCNDTRDNTMNNNNNSNDGDDDKNNNDNKNNNNDNDKLPKTTIK